MDKRLWTCDDEQAWCASTGINPPGGILPLPSVPSSSSSSSSSSSLSPLSFARQKFEPFHPRMLPPPPHHALSVPIPLVIRSPSRRSTSSSSSSSPPRQQHQQYVSSGILPSSSLLTHPSVIVDRDESGVGLITLLPAFATKATRTRNNEEFWDSMLLL